MIQANISFSVMNILEQWVLQPSCQHLPIIQGLVFLRLAGRLPRLCFFPRHTISAHQVTAQHLCVRPSQNGRHPRPSLHSIKLMNLKMPKCTWGNTKCIAVSSCTGKHVFASSQMCPNAEYTNVHDHAYIPLSFLVLFYCNIIWTFHEFNICFY